MNARKSNLGPQRRTSGAAFSGALANDLVGGKLPERWKAASLVLLAFFPVFMLALNFLNPGLRAVGIEGALATFIDSALGLALTTWPLMPLAIKLFRPWVFPAGEPAYVKYAAVLALIGCYALEITAWNLWA